MIRGLYTAASGMQAQQRKHDAITNNIANLQTPGYKAQATPLRSFPDMLIHLMEGQGVPPQRIGTLTTGVFAEESLPLYLQGDLLETNQPLDFAIRSNIGLEINGEPVPFDASGKAIVDDEVIFQPQAFFMVQGADGEPRFTRDGRFRLTEDRQLVTVNGEPVLSANGQPVIIPDIILSVDQIGITANGTLIDRTDGMEIANNVGGVFEPYQIIVRINNPYDLIREGNGNFRLAEGAEAPVAIEPEDEVVVMQGYTERSNVDPAQSMVDMMTALRVYEANQRVIQSLDQTLDKAVNEIGRV